MRMILVQREKELREQRVRGKRVKGQIVKGESPREKILRNNNPKLIYV